MIYTIDQALQELHEKDDAARIAYCLEHYKRTCEDCDQECHMSLRRKKADYHKTIGLDCNKNCRNYDCKNNPDFGKSKTLIN